MKILSVRVTEMPKAFGDEMPVVFGTLENGIEYRLFMFYPDEISFTADELVGLTIQEAADLRHKKDVAYLQS